MPLMMDSRDFISAGYSPFSTQPPINAQEDPEDPDQVIAAVDYGLDRYKDVGNLDFDFDESIEWGVDDVV